MLEKLRLKLAGAEALPLLVVLGIFSGVFAGAVIIVFRLTIELMQSGFLPLGIAENYEALTLTWRFFIPVIGATAIIALFYVLFKGPIAVGIVHVLERLAYHQGHLPVKNFLAQFVGAVLSIVSGHSVGREGPGVHLGSACGSLVGQWLKLPNNTLRILVACGAAASIAASFNTPIAGVIFAMEVIVMEYTIAGFAPIMLSAVSATLLTQSVFGNSAVFTLPTLKLSTLSELSALVVMGVLIGTLAAAFIWILRVVTTKTRQLYFSYRLLTAGVVTGIAGLVVPQIMGIGYDTVNAAMTGEIAVNMLLLIVVFKLIVTAVGLGLGLPGGLIGPTLVIGASAGAVAGIVAETFMPGASHSSGFYAMLGMAGMMGATLQAPLAALMALLELTVNTHVILPGMLVVIVAGLTSSHLFRQPGVFLMLLKERGLDYRNNPIVQSLRRVGVASIMSRSFVRITHQIRRNQAQSLLQKEPEWMVIEVENSPVALMPSVDLAQYLNMNQQDEIDLLQIPGQRQDSVAIGIRDTLQVALDTMDQHSLDVLYIGQKGRAGDSKYEVNGVVTRHMIESHYRIH